MDKVVQLEEEKSFSQKRVLGDEEPEQVWGPGLPCCYKRRIPGLSEGMPGVPRTLTRGWKIHESIT